jgi:2-polyprenyl-6-methoxyphenol hydroxylase-like FAD-dependent oxidoreductase
MTMEPAAGNGLADAPPAGGADDAAVIVVGYGPVGQLLALALAGAGHDVLVLEQHEQLWPFPRAGHLDHEVMRIFQGLGLAEEISAVCDESTEYVMYDSSGQVLRELPRRWATPSGWPASYHFYQPELEAVLHASAARSARISLRRGWQVTQVADAPDGAEIAARHVTSGQQRTFRAAYVVGADGANSTVRQAAGRAFTDLGFHADWLVVDVRLADGVDPGIPSTGQWCDPARPHHAARSHGRYARWEFMLLDSDDREEICRDASIWALLSGWLRPGEAEIIRRTVYTFRSAIATPWRRGRVALAGDAAHLMPPFLGQGMCSGLRDGSTLAWMLDLVIRGVSHPRLLDCYESERAGHVRRIIDESVRIGRVVCLTDPVAAADRDARMRQEPAVESPLLPALGPGVVSARPGPLAGRLSVQPSVRCAAGPPALLDSVLGPGFHLLGRDADPRQFLGRRGAELADRLGIRTAAIGRTPAAPVHDVTGVWCDWTEDAGAGLVLVRPDHYVFGSAAGPDAAGELLSELEARLCLT